MTCDGRDFSGMGWGNRTGKSTGGARREEERRKVKKAGVSSDGMGTPSGVLT